MITIETNATQNKTVERNKGEKKEKYIHKTGQMEGREFDGTNKSRCLRNRNKCKLTQYPDKRQTARLGKKNPTLLFTSDTDIIRKKMEKRCQENRNNTNFVMWLEGDRK